MARPEQDRSQAQSDHSRPRRRGGHELPDEVQDRPEQNAGYDEAVRGGAAGSPAELDVTAQDERVGRTEDFVDGDFIDEDAHHFGDLGEDEPTDPPPARERR